MTDTGRDRTGFRREVAALPNGRPTKRKNRSPETRAGNIPCHPRDEPIPVSGLRSLSLPEIQTGCTNIRTKILRYKLAAYHEAIGICQRIFLVIAGPSSSPRSGGMPHPGRPDGSYADKESMDFDSLISSAVSRAKREVSRSYGRYCQIATLMDVIGYKIIWQVAGPSGRRSTGKCENAGVISYGIVASYVMMIPKALWRATCF
jgi:hypothetical protein